MMSAFTDRYRPPCDHEESVEHLRYLEQNAEDACADEKDKCQMLRHRIVAALALHDDDGWGVCCVCDEDHPCPTIKALTE